VRAGLERRLGARGASDPAAWRARYFNGLLALAAGDAADAKRRLASADSALARARLERAGDSPDWGAGAIRAARGWLWLATGDTARGIAEMRAGLSAAGYGDGAIGAGRAIRYELALAEAALPSTRAEGVARLEAEIAADGALWPRLATARAHALARRDR